MAVWVLARPGADLEALAAEVARSGARVRVISRFVQGVSAVTTGGRLRELGRIPGVRRVQPVGSYHRGPSAVNREPGAVDGPRSTVHGQRADTLYGSAGWVADLLDLRALHVRGLRGAGARIAILDAGFNTAHPFLAGARVVAQRDFVNGDSVVRDQPGEPAGEMSHGTGVWSLLAANAPGILFGVAPDAEYLLAKTELTISESRTEEDNWVAALEWAVGLGAHIVSTSLGYLSFDGGFSYTRAQLNGDVAVTTVAADSAAARGVLVVVSVGNDGSGGAQSLSTPADADSVVAVGATDSLRQVPIFSSRGPTADGRIKPELVAPGVRVPVAAMDSGTSLGTGTSYSAPLVAGIAAAVFGARPDRPAAAMRVGLVRAGDRFRQPDNTRGAGIPDALKVYAFPWGLTLTGPAPGLLTTVTPTFSWDVGPQLPSAPTLFYLRVATDSLLRDRILDTIVATPSFTMPRPLSPGTRLYWRVVAASAVGVADSADAPGSVVAPAWATLLTLSTPAGASIRDSLPWFRWSSPATTVPPGPFTYDVDVYPASRSPLFAVARGRGLTDTAFRPPLPLERNLPFRWRVLARLGTDSAITVSQGTFLVIDESRPLSNVLFQNFPNPFPSAVTGQRSTCIWFDLATPGDVRLEVFDLRGRLVRRLAPSANVPPALPAGRYGRPAGDAPGTCDERFAWDGKDETGAWAREGVYVMRLTAPGFSDTRRLVFLGP